MGPEMTIQIKPNKIIFSGQWDLQIHAIEVKYYTMKALIYTNEVIRNNAKQG
jgi:hypothetical protein